MNEDKKIKITRRQTIGPMGAAALAVVGCNGDDGQSQSATATADPIDVATATGTESSTAAATATETTAATETATAFPVSCVVTPALTEGPYFVDERLNRSDIREDRMAYR